MCGECIKYKGETPRGLGVMEMQLFDIAFVKTIKYSKTNSEFYCMQAFNNSRQVEVEPGWNVEHDRLYIQLYDNITEGGREKRG